MQNCTGRIFAIGWKRQHCHWKQSTVLQNSAKLFDILVRPRGFCPYISVHRPCPWKFIHSKSRKKGWTHKQWLEIFNKSGSIQVRGKVKFPRREFRVMNSRVSEAQKSSTTAKLGRQNLKTLVQYVRFKTAVMSQHSPGPVTAYRLLWYCHLSECSRRSVTDWFTELAGL